jgi:hypothetical protein
MFRSISLLVVAALAMGFSIIHSTARADEMLTGPRPGENNPLNMAHPYVFRDDELFLFTGYSMTQNSRNHFFLPQRDDLSEWSQSVVDDGSMVASSSRFRHIAAAAGRLNSLKSDAVVYAFFDEQNFCGIKKYESAEDRWYGPVPSTCRYPSPSSTRSVDVAVADLDLAFDQEGRSHDEVVIAHYYYNSDSEQGVFVDVLGADLKDSISWDSVNLWPESRGGIVGVSIGDFNGDKHSEIALGIALTDQAKRRIIIYELPDTSSQSLKILSDTTFTQKAAVQCALNKNNAFEMTAGDFDRDGKDEIFLASSISPCQDNVSLLDMSVLSFDEKATPSVAWWGTAGLEGYIPDGLLRVESGLFRFDPDTGWVLNRPQVALCHVLEHSWDTSVNWIECRIYELGIDLAASLASLFNFSPSMSTNEWFSGLDITIGNFIGQGQDGKAESPLMQLAVSYTSNYMDEVGRNHKKKHGLRIFPKPMSNHSIFYRWDGSWVDYDPQSEPFMPTAIAAADIDGNTYRLGAPIHIVVEDLLGLDYIIQEPPKHVDYLPIDEDVPDGPWDVINVSALSGFNVEFMDSNLKTFETKSTDTTNHKIGAGLEFGPNNSLLKELAPCEMDADVKVSYDYESSKSEWNSQYSERTTAFTSKTEKDDFLAGKIQLIDIWRYPVLGYDTGDTTRKQAFKEIFLPGPKSPFSGGGLDHADWYQPVHQNTNVLSYPLISSEPYQNEMGSFKLPDGTDVPGPMNDMSEYDFSGISQTLNIEWTETAGSGSEKSYSHTLSESADFSIGYKFWFIDAGKMTASFHNSNSWGNTTDEECYNTESEGITINVPSGDHENAAYIFQPAVYISNEGGHLKVAHAVDLLTNSQGNEWWRKQYGRKADPALNLPNRMKWNCRTWSQSECLDEYWTLNEDHARMEMRGFLMTENTPDPLSHAYTPLAGPPADGDIVRLCARVYNFALFEKAEFFDVLFEYIPVDQVADEIGSRVAIGTVTTSLDEIMNSGTGRSIREVCVPWDTRGLADSQYTYRFYVTVDPHDAVEGELHEWKEESGIRCMHGNNEGYWPWGAGIPVLKPDTSASEKKEGRDDIRTEAKSLALLKNGRLRHAPGVVKMGETYKLRAHIKSTHDRSRFHNVTFSEGPPGEGKVISVKRVGIIEGDSYVWANWTPQQPGRKQLYVHISEHLGDTKRGNNSDRLPVIVQKRKK